MIWYEKTSKEGVETIQYTPDKGGYIRVRIDSITPWVLRKCKRPSDIMYYAEVLLKKQREAKNEMPKM